MEIVGLAAAACVLATFCMQYIVALRGFAMVSNLLFIIYGAGANLVPIVLLHAVLLPINGWSLGKLFGGRLTAVTFGVCSACASCLLTTVAMQMHFVGTMKLPGAVVRSVHSAPSRSSGGVPTNTAATAAGCSLLRSSPPVSGSTWVNRGATLLEIKK